MDDQQVMEAPPEESSGTYLDDIPEVERTPDQIVQHTVLKNARADRPFEDVAKEIQTKIPGSDPSKLQDFYKSAVQNNKLENAHKALEGTEETNWSRISRRSIPYAAELKSFLQKKNYAASTERFNKNEASQEDIDTIAGHQHLKNLEANYTTGQKVQSIFENLPAIVGETYTGGIALRGAAKLAPRALGFLAPEAAAAAIGRTAAGTATRSFATGAATAGQAATVAVPRMLATGTIGGGAARLAAEVPIIPAVWMDHWAQGNIDAHRDPSDLRGVLPAMALGALQLGVLKAVANTGLGGEIEGKGVGPWLQRAYEGTKVGMVGQAGADLGSAVINQVLPQAYRLPTAYGPMGAAAKGEWGQAGEEMFLQMVTFAAFSALHAHNEPPGPGQRRLKDAAEAQKDQAFDLDALQTYLMKKQRSGVSSEAAARQASMVGDIFSELLKNNPSVSRAQAMEAAKAIDAGPDRAQAMAEAEAMPKGKERDEAMRKADAMAPNPLQDLARTIANSFPKHPVVPPERQLEYKGPEKGKSPERPPGPLPMNPPPRPPMAPPTDWMPQDMPGSEGNLPPPPQGPAAEIPKRGSKAAEAPVAQEAAPEPRVAQPAQKARMDLLPPGWKMEVDPKTDRAEVDYHGNRIIFKAKEDMENPSVVNHEIAHVVVERVLAEKDREQLLKDYAEAKADDPLWKKHGAKWIIEHGYHQEEIAIDLGDYLDGTPIDPKVKSVFDKHFGSQAPEAHPRAGPAPLPPEHAKMTPAEQFAFNQKWSKEHGVESPKEADIPPNLTDNLSQAEASGNVSPQEAASLEAIMRWGSSRNARDALKGTEHAASHETVLKYAKRGLRKLKDSNPEMWDGTEVSKNGFERLEEERAEQVGEPDSRDPNELSERLTDEEREINDNLHDEAIDAGMTNEELLQHSMRTVEEYARRKGLKTDAVLDRMMKDQQFAEEMRNEIHDAIAKRRTEQPNPVQPEGKPPVPENTSQPEAPDATPQGGAAPTAQQGGERPPGGETEAPSNPVKKGGRPKYLLPDAFPTPMDPDNTIRARRMIQRLKQYTKKEIKQWADEQDIPVSGTHPKMIRQLEDHVFGKALKWNQEQREPKSAADVAAMFAEELPPEKPISREMEEVKTTAERVLGVAKTILRENDAFWDYEKTLDPLINGVKYLWKQLTRGILGAVKKSVPDYLEKSFVPMEEGSGPQSRREAEEIPSISDKSGKTVEAVLRLSTDAHLARAQRYLDQMGVHLAQNLSEALPLRAKGFEDAESLERSLSPVMDELHQASWFARDQATTDLIQKKKDEIQKVLQESKDRNLPVASALPEFHGKKGAREKNLQHAREQLGLGAEFEDVVEAVMKHGGLAESTARRYVMEATRKAAVNAAVLAAAEKATDAPDWKLAAKIAFGDPVAEKMFGQEQLAPREALEQQRLTEMEQAKDLEGFLKSDVGGQPLPSLQDIVKGVNDFWQEIKKNTRNLGDSFNALLSPSSRGAEARVASGSIRERLAKLARDKSIARKGLEEAERHFNDTIVDEPDPAKKEQKFLEFTDAIEHGRIGSLPKELIPLAQAIRKMNVENESELVKRGLIQDTIDNYLGHIWKKPNSTMTPDEIGRMLGARRPLAGSEAYKKERSLPTYRDGIDAGLEPVDWNPVRLALMKSEQVQKSIMAHDLVAELNQRGMWEFVHLGHDAPEGWKRIDDKLATMFTKGRAGPELRGHFYTPEPVAALLDNYLKPGLRGNAMYDAVRSFGNLQNNFQLGWSAFHLGLVAMESQVSKGALAAQYLSRGQLGKTLGKVGEAGVPLLPFIRNLWEGSKMSREYYKPGSEGQETTDMVKSFVEAGGRATMDDFYKNGHLDAFREAYRQFRKGQVGKAGSMLWHALPALGEAVSHPLMEIVVPRVKMGAFADMARYELENLGPNADIVARRAALGKAYDSVENRLGQMTYDNLFWNRTFKDLMMVGIRSVGWNLGTAREIGGGLKDIPSSLGQTLKGQGISSRLAYVVGLPMVAGFYGAMYQYMATGKGPDELKDYFFPKTGRKRPDGTPDRVALPSYMRDVAHVLNRSDEGPLRVAQNAAEMAKGKINPGLATTWQMLENQDFYGTAIRNSNDPAMKQTIDTAKALLATFEPISVQAFMKQREQGASVGQSIQSGIGISPAPSRATHTFQEQRDAETAHLRELTPLGKLQHQQAVKEMGPDVANYYSRLGSLESARTNSPERRQGRRFAREDEFQSLNKFKAKIDELAHRIKGERKTSRGIVDVAKPAPEEISRLRTLQTDLARRALEMSSK